MSAPLRLVLFDVDGTLVDSQSDIVDAMGAAFGAVDAALPPRATVLSGVGLSLDHLFPMLAPELSRAAHLQMAEAYKAAYMRLRAERGVAQSSPMYEGARDVLAHLGAQPDILLGVATGKSRRGLDKLIEGHGLQNVFFTRQVADDHPSKPHPSMVLSALSETGVAAENAVMIGDTSYDMDMAAAACVRGIGVSWGYHPRERLHQAHATIDSYADLLPALDQLWSVAA